MRRLGLAFLAVLAGAMVFVGWFPVHRLSREIAAARKEGVWTELGDVRRAIAQTQPKGENAAPLVRETIARGQTLGSTRSKAGDAAAKVLKGTANAAEREAVRAFVVQNGAYMDAWRAASRLPGLDYGRKWEDGYAVLFPEYADLKGAAKLLSASAALGIDPKGNLLAAARLSVLIRQEPTLIGHLVSVAMGRIALREATRHGLGREVEAALGPPIDVRWAFAFEFPNALDSMQMLGTPRWQREMLGNRIDEGLMEKLKHTGSWKANATWRVMRDLRALWREMPTDGTDYEAAARALKRWMPGIQREMSSSSQVFEALMGDPDDYSETIQVFQRFESERKKSRG